MTDPIQTPAGNDTSTHAECGAYSPTRKWGCSRGAHEDAVHLAGYGDRSILLAIWTDDELIAEKEQGVEEWEGATW